MSKNVEKLELDFNMNPVDRLTKEIEFTEFSYKKCVGQFLLGEFTKDEKLAETYNSKQRTLDEVWNYIESQARSKANKQSCAMIEDKEVYGWAIHYIQDGEQKEEKEKAETYTLTKEEKKSLEDQAKEEYLAEQKAKLEEAEKKRIEIEKRAKEKAIEKEKKEREEIGQMSLFDFGDENE